ncbi:MAG: phosphate/phosphite/phosphonate ABC transporter substrate-binding protein [Deferribacterales bacterium]
MKISVLTFFLSFFCLTSAFGQPLKFGIASIVSPEESLNLYSEMNDYLSEKLGKPIVPVIKRDYDEMNRMIAENEVDIASVCTGALPYLNDKQVRVLAVPENEGKHSYRSFIIANKKYGIKSISDLQGKVFAFTDRLSNSGTLYPSFMVIQKFQKTPEKVFSKIYYTKSHDRSIYLVNKGVIQAAAVDSLIFNFIKANEPEKVSNIAVIHQSSDLISPPIVASANLSKENYDKIRKILLDMDKDKKGKSILKRLKIDRFVPASVEDYHLIKKMKAEVDKFYSETHTRKSK